MRWITYFILAYVVIGLQVGLSGYVSVREAQPSLILLAAVFIAINAPRDAALLGCFAMGALQDLLTQEPLGLYALSYGLVGMLVVSTQEVVYREHPLTHFSMALFGSLVTGALLVLHGMVRGPHVSIATCLSSALYTAVLAPFVLGVLQRGKRLFAFEPARSARRRMRG